MIGDRSLTHRECGDTFLALLTSGAISMSEPRPPTDHRCPGCDKVISHNKSCCLSCGIRALQEDAEYIRTSDELEMYLSHLDASERVEARKLIEPMMMKKWEKAEPVGSNHHDPTRIERARS